MSNHSELFSGILLAFLAIGIAFDFSSTGWMLTMLFYLCIIQTIAVLD